MPLLVTLRNNHKLHGAVVAYDRHCNLVMTNVTEMWEEPLKKGATEPTQKDRLIPKLFVRGDSVILVIKDPAGAREG